MSDWLKYLLCILLSYLSGAVLYSYHVPLLLKGVNVVAESEDHNPGTSNAFKRAGVPVGLLSLSLDMAKGYFPLELSAQMVGMAHPVFSLIMLAPVLGHATAPFYPFPGGKAIAVSFGVLLGLLPESQVVFLLAALYVFFSVVRPIHPNERRSVWVFFLLAILSAAGSLYTRRFPVMIGCLLISTVVISKNWAGRNAR